MFAEGVRYDDIRRWACGNLLTAPRLGIIIEGAGYSEEEIQALKETVGVNEDGALTIYEKRYAGQRFTKNVMPVRVRLLFLKIRNITCLLFLQTKSVKHRI